MILSFLAALNSLSPLAVIALLALVLFFQARNKIALTSVTDNHLSGLPDMAASLARIENLLMAINENMIWVKARMNGGGPHA